MKSKGKKSTKNAPPRPPLVMLPTPNFAALEGRDAWESRALSEYTTAVTEYVEAVRAWQSARTPAADSDPNFEPGGGSSGGGGETGGW